MKFIRALWWLTLVAAVAILLASLPSYFTTGSATPTAPPFSVWAQVGVWLGIVLSLTAAGLSIGLACLLFWKKRIDPMALYLSFYLLLYGIISCGPLERLFDYWLPQYPNLGSFLQGTLFGIPGLVLILIFPNGHFVPRWTRVL